MDERPELGEFVERARGLSAKTQLDQAAAEVIEALEAAGVEPVLLKGPALAQLLYRPTERRSYSDVDLLVGPDDLEPTRRKLAGLGFVNAATDWFNRFLVGSDPEMLHAELWTRQRGLDPVMVDLHWKLEGCEAPTELAWRHLTAALGAIEVAGRRVAVLAPPGLALHVAIHAAQHGPSHARAMADLERGLKRWSRGTWRDAADLAKHLDGADTFAAGLRLTPAGIGLADELGLASAETTAWSIQNRDVRPRGTFHLSALARAPGVRGRSAVLRRVLIPPREWITLQHPWAARGRGLLAAGYVAHMARAPVWAGRAWRYRRRELRAGD